MPIQPNSDFLESKPVLAEDAFGTLRYEDGSWRYWLDFDGRVRVEERVAFGSSGWRNVTHYNGNEMP